MPTWLITGCSTGLGRALAQAAFAAAEDAFGGVDVLVNNAGYGYRAAVEEGDELDIRALFETHFYRPAAMIKAALPGELAPWASR